MPRIARWMVIVMVLAVSATAALAQPSGGNAQATPAPPATRPPIIEDFDDLLRDPQTAMGELTQLVTDILNDFVRENQVKLQRNIDAFPAASQVVLVRVIALALGAIALLFPHSTKGVAWLFLGAAAGALISQMPLGSEIRLMLARNDMRFMLEELPGTVGLIVGFAIAGMVVLWPAYFMLMAATGSFVGVAIALQIAADNPNLTEGAVAIGSILGFILMSAIAGRATLLIPMVVGAVLVAFALGVGPGWIMVLVLLSAFIATVRSPKLKARLKRVGLPTLTLQEGKVDLSPNRNSKTKKRDHLHEIIPAMADDRDNPLIKR